MPSGAPAAPAGASDAGSGAVDWAIVDTVGKASARSAPTRPPAAAGGSGLGGGDGLCSAAGGSAAGGSAAGVGAVVASAGSPPAAGCGESSPVTSDSRTTGAGTAVVAPFPPQAATSSRTAARSDNALTAEPPASILIGVTVPFLVPARSRRAGRASASRLHPTGRRRFGSCRRAVDLPGHYGDLRPNPRSAVARPSMTSEPARRTNPARSTASGTWL